jgi:hypothetical protein
MAAIKPRTARVVIYQGDDLARLSELDDAVTRAEDALKRAERDKRTRLMHEADPVAPMRDECDRAKVERDAFAAEAEVRGVIVVMHALQRREWRALTGEHGPREGNKRDDVLGVNMDTLPDVLLPKAICRDETCPICRDMEQASTIEGDTVDFLDSLSDYDYYDRLFLQAFAVNRGSAPADPTLRLGSVPSQISDAI